MKTIGNLLWFFLGGFWEGLTWWFFGLLWCLSIVGIPVGIQCFKFSTLVMWPFGKKIEYSTKTSSFLLNILWILLGGLPIALTSLAIGLGWCASIVGIPFGIQSFKFAKLALMPFGAKIIKA